MRKFGLVMTAMITAFVSVASPLAVGKTAQAAGINLDAPVIGVVEHWEDGSITLDWEDIAKADSYKIFRKAEDESKFKVIDKIEADESEYIDDSTEEGVTYTYKIRAFRTKKGVTYKSKYSAKVEVAPLEQPKMRSVKYNNDGETVIKWNVVEGASGYEVYKTKKKGTEGKLYKKIENPDTTMCKDILDELPHTKVYYSVRAYFVSETGLVTYTPFSPTKKIEALYRIMGESRCTPEQIAAYYHMREAEGACKYPSEVYKNYGAPTIEDFAQIVYEECEAEGVRAEVLFGQSMIETGLLMFTQTSVLPEYCNFAGMGVTGGADQDTLMFDSVRMGVRCQAQHLKAYGSTEPLNNELIDKRFVYVPRGCGVFVRWLGIPENPIGRGWAASPDYPYGDLIVDNYVTKILEM